jgi:hypothetical protein
LALLFFFFINIQTSTAAREMAPAPPTPNPTPSPILAFVESPGDGTWSDIGAVGEGEFVVLLCEEDDMADVEVMSADVRASDVVEEA